MKQKNKLMQMLGWLLFLIAIGFFCLQMGYFYVHARFQVEYIDNRIFYIVNIICIICLATAMMLLLKMTKKWFIIVASIVFLFTIVNATLLKQGNQQVKNVTSIAPDFKHVLSIKEDTIRQKAIYYRSYFKILARPKEKLPHQTDSKFKVKWLANDVAAVTYQTADGSLHQFIGTYGDRGGGTSYYYVAPEIQGKWKGENEDVISDTEGVSVTVNNKTTSYDWDHIQQFGTLAVVLINDEEEAEWTIALNEDFQVHSDGSIPQTGSISLYEATMKKNNSMVLDYVDER